MSIPKSIEILGVKIKGNLLKMKEKLGFQILFELKKTLTKNLNVRFVYIQSPSNEKKDEELDTYEIPCNKIGKFKVNFSVTPPRLCFEKAS